MARIAHQAPIARPPALLDAFVRRLVPPAVREDVVGDLWERYRSPLTFTGQALRALPWLFFAQVRRTAVVPVLGVQFFVLFACFGGFEFRSSPPAHADALIATLAALAGLALRDAYRSADSRTLRRAVGDVLAVLVGVAMSQIVLRGLIDLSILPADWRLPPRLLVFGAFALPVLIALRTGTDVDDADRTRVRPRTVSLATEYDRYRRRVSLRNLAESGALAAVAIGSTAYLGRYGTPAGLASWLMIGGFAVLAAALIARGWAPRLAGVDAPNLAVGYGRELLRQHRLRRVVVWWWFVPLFVGVITGLVVPALVADRVLAALSGVASIGLLGYCIDQYNALRGRRVQSEVERLRGVG